MTTKEELEELVKIAVASRTTDVVRQPFDIDESIGLIRQLEQRGTEFKVMCGLELIKAKRNVKHGAWYWFLDKAHLYPTVATRRMQIARQFLEWQSKQENLANNKPCLLHDFAISLKIDRDLFLEEVPKTENQFLLPPAGQRGNYPSVNLKQWKKIEQYIRNGYKKLTPYKKQEFRDLLQMQADRGTALVRLLEEVDKALPAKKTRPTLDANQDMLVDGTDKPAEPESDQTTS